MRMKLVWGVGAWYGVGVLSLQNSLVGKRALQSPTRDQLLIEYLLRFRRGDLKWPAVVSTRRVSWRIFAALLLQPSRFVFKWIIREQQASPSTHLIYGPGHCREEEYVAANGESIEKWKSGRLQLWNWPIGLQNCIANYGLFYEVHRFISILQSFAYNIMHSMRIHTY